MKIFFHTKQHTLTTLLVFKKSDAAKITLKLLNKKGVINVGEEYKVLIILPKYE